MRLSSAHPQLRRENGCVVSYCPTASAIGARVLREGGNAVDAAVATALALAVTYPQAGNLGGGGFMLVDAGDCTFLDYRETAPRRLTPDAFADAAPDAATFGARAVGVPGTVAGLAAALDRYGSFGWDRVVGYAIELAEQGFWITSRQAGYFALYAPELARLPSTRNYFTDRGRAIGPGVLFRQPDLGRTLRRLAEDGPAAFYTGPIGEQLVAEIARGGGVLDREDLAGYLPQWRQPERLTFGATEVFTAPLPSGGGMVVRLSLAFAEQCALLDRPAGSVERLALLARIFRCAQATRLRFAGDPDHLTPGELAETHEALERVLTEGLDAVEARLAHTPPAVDARAALRSSTTHFCVLDGAGMAVSNTFSLNTMFGSKLAVDGAGFLLNSCMDDFALAPDRPNWYELLQGDRNLLAPGRRAASSMSPTIVRRDGEPAIVVGASGGPRIPTMITQVLLHVLGDGLPLGEAVRLPRIHHQYQPDELGIEEQWAPEIGRGLEAHGYRIARLPLLGMGAGIARSGDQLAAVLDSRCSLD